MTKKAYVCGVDWQHEIGEVNDVVLFSSVEALKEARTCWQECGIVELELTVKEWAAPQNMSELSQVAFAQKPKKKRKKKTES